MKNEMKIYILGMAKSAIQVEKGSFGGIANGFTKSISPGPLRNLELDFLRLVYVAKELISKGNVVHSYLMVTTEIVKGKVENWREKYQVDKNLVNIVSANLSVDEIMVLVNEKKKNRISNTVKSTQGNEGALANKGRVLIEKKLSDYIEKSHGKGELIISVKEKPFQINWDYCRV